jgi:hypothetical protein
MIHKKKLNVLCLHGCTLTASTFKILPEMRSIENRFKDQCNFQYITAPFPAMAEGAGLIGNTWFSMARPPDFGYSTSAKLCEDAVSKFGGEPIDVLIGYSKGGQMAATLIWQKSKLCNNLKGAIMFRATDIGSCNIARSAIGFGVNIDLQIPTLHLYSSWDGLVLKEIHSKNLASRFRNKTEIEVSGCHINPMGFDDNTLNQIALFLGSLP